MYNQSEFIEKGVMISVSLLKCQNLESLSTLKNLLTFIPNPVDIQEVLRQAICNIIYTSPQTSYWLFQHPDCLSPQIKNIREVIIEELSKKLLSWGLSPEEFHFNSEGRLRINSPCVNQFIKSREISSDEAILGLISVLIVNCNCCHEL